MDLGEESSVDMSHRETRRAAVLAIMAVLVIGMTPAAEAQYFGRNKVQYRDFDFKVLKTANFDIYYYPEEEPAIEQAGRLAERWYARLSRQLNHRFSKRQPLILYASHPDFEQTNVLTGFIGEGTGGVTEVFKRRVVMPLAGPLAESDHVLGHELVHAFQFDMTGRGGATSSSNIPNALQLPLWFIEGMAEYLSVGPIDPHTAMWMRDAARREKMPTIRQLNDPDFFPYRYGQALWSYVAGRWGDEVVAQALRAASRNADPERILESVTGLGHEELSRQWHLALRDAYAPIYTSKKDPAAYGRVLVSEGNAGDLNVAPALSPDGSRVVFFSEKDLFSIDMYLADAASGRVRRKIVETASDPHFDSLQFINSSGDWDAAGRRFAFGGVRKGKPVLVVLNPETGDREREIEFKELGEITDPTWSPDGQSIAFSAIVGGLTDLFVHDLRSGATRRLTNDAFADLQPSWSPDGRTIAFVTDRYSTRLENLRAGNYRLAAIDPGSGDIRPLASFEEGKNIDPEWSADGGSLFFVSDRNGISNVYRLDVAAGTTSQVTDLVTGVSGITGLSPALSVGRGRLVYSAYEDDKHRIYAIEDPARLAGFAPSDVEDRLRAATLPPRNRSSDETLAYRNNPDFGLPKQASADKTEYKPKLSLDYIGQPTVSVGANRMGAFVGGGVSFLFSDILGHHTLGTVLQVNGQFEDLGGVVYYENKKHRWTWGTGIELIPYVTGSFASGIQGNLYIEQVELFRQSNRSLSAYVAYPFSRAHRVELTGALRNIGFSAERQTRVFSAVTGDFISETEEDIPTQDGLTFGQAAAALVYDTSTFGATSPILGRRYRLEVAPAFGSLNFTGVLADVRQYFMPIRPFTLAFRGMHYGRYGSGSEDSRLSPLFIGYPNLVRGYDTGSFEASECGPNPESSCPVFDQLLGSKMVVGNAELRFPPFGAISRSRRNLYGPVPLELVAFADTGVAWTEDIKPKFLDGTRDFVTSVGAGARVNLFGYVIAEVDYVRPLDRQGWHWVFNFSPGF
jgi:Tol biopolymer transport system component